MNYHRVFDRLGNQATPPKSTTTHRLIQRASLAICLVCVGILIWGR
jgi:hypothetical protein